MKASGRGRPIRSAGRPLLLLPLLVLLLLGIERQTAAPAAAQQSVEVDSPTLRAAITALLAADPAGPSERVARVTRTPAGDLTVVFALRDIDDDPALIGAGGGVDALRILQTVYGAGGSGDGPVATATVLGTYTAYGKWGRPVERPLLRVVVSAEHADRLQGASPAPSQIAGWADEWWAVDDLRAGLGGRLMSAPSDWPDFRRRLEVMLVHLNEALFALASEDMRITRSQFSQFFDAWDRVDDEVLKPEYPETYATLDLALNQVELALLHSQPEDPVAARTGLRALRTGVQAIADEFDSQN